MLVSATIPNLINGVSQQPDVQRLLSQGEIQENHYDTISEGKMKRFPTEHLKVLDTAGIGNVTDAQSVYTHWVDWGLSSRYVAVITSGAIRVFDLAGVEQTVNLGTGASTYLTLVGSSDAASNFRGVNFQDSAVVLNRTVVPAALTQNALNSDQFLVFIKSGNYSTDYKVSVLITDGGVQTTYTASKTTSATVANDIKTTQIASDLATAINAVAPAGKITVTVKESVLHIAIAGGSTATALGVTISDSQGTTNMRAVKDTVQFFSDLPTIAPQSGFNTIKVVGDGASLANPYYVKFAPFVTTTAAGVQMQSGAWVETLAAEANAVTGLNPATMPYVLTKTGPTTFSFAQATWIGKLVGDNGKGSNPSPSFVGTAISDIFLHKNRLGLAAGNSLSLSKVGDYYNFFRSTVTGLLDNDVINITIAHAKMAKITAAIPYQNSLILFTNRSQFAITSDTLLTPKTVGASLIAEYESTGYCRPVSSGSSLFFPFTRGLFSGIREFNGITKSLNYTDVTAQAEDLTGHIPKYISGSVYRLEASKHDDVLLVNTPDDPSTVYFYKYFWAGDTRAQYSWSKWTFGTGVIIRGFVCFEATIYAVVQRPAVTLLDGVTVVPGGTHLEKINLALGQVDPNGATYLTLLDRRVSEASCTASYDAINNITSWVLPYRITGTMNVVTRAGGVNRPGVFIPILSADNYTIKVSGNYLTSLVYFGQAYKAWYRFSKQYARQPGANGTVSVDVQSRLQMKLMKLLYSNSGYFRTEVTPVNRSTFTKIMGRILSGATLLGDVVIESGEHTFLLQSKNDHVTIDLINDSHLPSNIVAGEWFAEFIPRSQRI